MQRVEGPPLACQQAYTLRSNDRDKRDDRVVLPSACALEHSRGRGARFCCTCAEGGKAGNSLARVCRWMRVAHALRVGVLHPPSVLDTPIGVWDIRMVYDTYWTHPCVLDTPMVYDPFKWRADALEVGDMCG